MTVTDTITGRFKIISSDGGTVLAALGEVMQYLNDNGINMANIIRVDATNKLAVIKIR